MFQKILIFSFFSGIKSEVRSPVLEVPATPQSALYSTADTFDKDYSQAYTSAHQYYNRYFFLYQLLGVTQVFTPVVN